MNVSGHVCFISFIDARLTSGAIQNGVPTDVFLRSRALVSWAETPEESDSKIHLLEH